jgi:hypothetical protein
MTRKQESITLSVAQEEKAELENIALEFGCTWGEGKPNISKLVKQIAQRELLLSKADKPAKQKREKRALIKDAIASIQDALTILLELI